MAPKKCKWTQEKEDQVVEMWQQRTLLYDPSSADYHNKALKTKAVQDMATALDLSVKDVETRLTTLRTQFSKLSRPGRAPISKSSRTQWLLRSLDFLKPYISHRPCLDSPNSDEDEEEPQSPELSASTDNEEACDAEVSSPSPTRPFTPTLTSTLAVYEAGTARHRWKSGVAKRQKKHYDDLESQKFAILQEMARTAKEDEVDIFVKSLGNEMRQIKDKSKLPALKVELLSSICRVQSDDNLPRPPAPTPTNYFTPHPAHAHHGHQYMFPHPPPPYHMTHVGSPPMPQFSMPSTNFTPQGQQSQGSVSESVCAASFSLVISPGHGIHTDSIKQEPVDEVEVKLDDHLDDLNGDLPAQQQLPVKKHTCDQCGKNVLSRDIRNIHHNAYSRREAMQCSCKREMYSQYSKNNSKLTSMQERNERDPTTVTSV